MPHADAAVKSALKSPDIPTDGGTVMQISLLFQIAGVGILTTVVSTVLASSGRSELANLSAVAGLAVVLLMVVNLLSELFTSVRTIFQLY